MFRTTGAVCLLFAVTLMHVIASPAFAARLGCEKGLCATVLVECALVCSCDWPACECCPECANCMGDLFIECCDCVWDGCGGKMAAANQSAAVSRHGPSLAPSAEKAVESGSTSAEKPASREAAESRRTEAGRPRGVVKLRRPPPLRTAPAAAAVAAAAAAVAEWQADVRRAMEKAVEAVRTDPVPGYLCPTCPNCTLSPNAQAYLQATFGFTCPTQGGTDCSANAEQQFEVELLQQWAQCYVVIPSSRVQAAGGEMPQQDVQAWLANSSLPAPFQELALIVARGGSALFEKFNYSYFPALAEVGESVGVAKNVNGNVTIAYIDGGTSAQLVTKYQTITRRVCHSCWIWATCCHNEQQTVVRPLNAQEVLNVEQTLAAVQWAAFRAAVAP